MGEEESRTRRRTVVGMRTAIEEMFGPSGLEAAQALLPEESLVALFHPRHVGQTWIAECHLTALVDAVFAGPCGRNRLKLRDWSRLQIMQGFGRVKAAMLRVVTPEILATRAAALWKDEHSHGALAATLPSPRTAVLTLADHEYVDHALARVVFAESMRTVVAASYFAKDVSSSFELSPTNTLVISLVWR